MLCRVDADRVPKEEEEGGGSRLRTDLRRRGLMRCAVVRAVLEGRMSRLDFVVEVAAVAAAGVLVVGLAVAGFAFAPSRRPS